MYSIKDIYKIGKGPSSSHTMGPLKAAKTFLSLYGDCDSYKVILYGSLAKTGKGHHTDLAVKEGLCNIHTEIEYDTVSENLPHENTMDFFGYKDGVQTCSMRAMSIGGGDIEIVGMETDEKLEIYRHSHFSEISEYCKSRNMRISEYVYAFDDPDIKDYLRKVWHVMLDCIKTGLSTRGILEGGIGVERRAQALYNSKHIDESPSIAENRLVCAYAFAVGEENADFGTVVTAPTCGACSVVPAVLKYMSEKRNISEDKVIDALAVAGIIGNIVKTNASISGAECGCQAEMGTACSMASAALCELLDMGIDQIEYAAEVSMEHQLGLTCDPIKGLVQIPCIERGAVSAMKAINAMTLANFLTDSRKISFDQVVNTMYKTGKDMNSRYRETSEGGLADLFTFRNRITK